MRRKVAIKVLPQSRVDDSSYLARFYRERRPPPRSTIRTSCECS